MRDRTQKLIRVTIGCLVFAWVLLVVWIFMVIPISATPPGIKSSIDLLVPLTIVAVLIERFLQTIFSVVEGNWRTLMAYFTYGMRWLKEAETELAESRKWFWTAGALYNGAVAALHLEVTNILEEYQRKVVHTLSAHAVDEPDARLQVLARQTAERIMLLSLDELPQIEGLLVSRPPDVPIPYNILGDIRMNRESMLKQVETTMADAAASIRLAESMLRDAHGRVNRAENQLTMLSSAPDYRTAKAVAAVVIGPLIGVALATLGQFQIFAALGAGGMSAQMDVFLTGLVLGTSSLPAHSAISALGDLTKRIGAGKDSGAEKGSSQK